MWPVAGPRRRNGWNAVVEALEQVQVLRDPAGRRLCLDLLTQYLGLSLPVRHFSSTRQHLYSILLACDQHPAALRTFLNVLGELEPGSQAVSAVRRMLSDDVPRQRGEEPSTRPALWGGVPPRNGEFACRTDLLGAIRNRLDEGTVVLSGTSETAAEYAYRHAADYELVWWISAREPVQIRISLVDLAMRLRLPVEPGTQAAVPAVLAALRRGDPYRNWLLVFDDAGAPADLRPFLPGGQGHVLVTSRNPQWPDPVRTEPRAEQDPRDAMERLRKQNPGAFGVLRICAFFAREPVSRSLFAAVPDLPSYSDLSETLRDRTLLNRALRDIGRSGLARVDHRTDTIQLNPSVCEVLREQVEFRHLAHLVLASADPHQPQRAENWRRYADLMPHVLAGEAAGCGDQRVRRLVLNILEFWFAWGEPPDARRMASELAERWRTWLGPVHRDTVAASRWLGRALRLEGDFDRAIRVDEETLRRLREHHGEDHEDTLLSAHAVASDLRAKGDFHAARDLNADSYRRARSRFGADDPETFAAADDYALSLRLCGELDMARRLDEDTWHRKADVLGEHHCGTLSTLDHWAADLLACGDWLQGVRTQESTVRRLREHVGVRHPATLTATRNLAVARRLAGDPARALPLAQVAFDGLVSRYGDCHPDVTSAAMTVSVNLRKLGRHEEARQLGVHVHDRYAQTWGTDHPFTFAAATNLAVTLHALGELPAARGLNSRALSGMRAQLGDDHPFTLVCAINLANDLARGGRYDHARELGRDTLGQAGQALPENHPLILIAATNLALDLRGAGLLDESAELQRDTVTRLGEVLGPAHPLTANARENRRVFGDIDTPQIW